MVQDALCLCVVVKDDTSASSALVTLLEEHIVDKDDALALSGSVILLEGRVVCPEQQAPATTTAGAGSPQKKRWMVAGELAVVMDREVAAWLISSKESASSNHCMSLASSSLPSGPTAQSDIV